MKRSAGFVVLFLFIASIQLLVAAAPSESLHFSSNPSVAEISRARVFEEPLVPIGGTPGQEESLELAAALSSYADRNGPDDFGALTQFLNKHPKSHWNASLLTGLGLEYYNTAHYSLALDAWKQAWAHASEPRQLPELLVMNRAAAELAGLYSRLGRMDELEAHLKSVEGRFFLDTSAQKINSARDGLWMMKNRPEVSFRCGALAVNRIALRVDPAHSAADCLMESASTTNGFSLREVAGLAKKSGLDFQMAFRHAGADFIVPSVVHWKVGHYAALVRQEGDRYLLEDPTFVNTVWATREALESEVSGYFLVPAGKLPAGWRGVADTEGRKIWGKGQTSGNDPDLYTCSDPQTTPCGASGCQGMALSSVHLMLVNLQIRDTPVGYRPPVGPPVAFTVRYNQRGGQTINVGSWSYTPLLGFNWTHDWRSWITDQPQSPQADVKLYVGGGGARTFTQFNSSSQTFAPQQYDETLLRRTSSNSYDLVYPDGSKRVFASADGSVGSTRSVYLSQIVDAQGNPLNFTYDTNLLLIAVTDAIGQTTTLTYSNYMTIGGFQENKITTVTDPFGRTARFDYGQAIVGYILVGSPPVSQAVYDWDLYSITDVLGLTSQVGYQNARADFIDQLVTPYGTNHYTTGGSGTTRWLETTYADGSRDRVEYTHTNNTYGSDPGSSVPTGMSTMNQYLQYRNTYYWNRNACATSYGDYRKARVYHWLHTADLSTTSGMLESTKQPLEGRVWYNYAGQSSSIAVGTSARPTRIGRVLDDGSTQLYSYSYNALGHLTNTVDSLGRSFSYIYDTNGMDRLETRQTRAGKNELLQKRTYNQQHRPLTITDAAGQTATYTYNSRGQRLTATNAKGETSSYRYDNNGYLIAIDGPLAGTNDTVTIAYDAFGRTRTVTGPSGYTVTVDYDAMDRVTRMTCPDGTYTEYTYDLLNISSFRDRKGRITTFQHGNMRQIEKIIDPLGRTTLFDWCRCGSLRSLTDALGHKTSWTMDIQERITGKQYADGSLEQYDYEDTTSRVRSYVDENLQRTTYTYNRDNTLRSISYVNSAIATSPVYFDYDPDYERVTSISDAVGSTRFAYNPVANPPTPGAGRIHSIDGPLPVDTITYEYDELGRKVSRDINGTKSSITFDARSRVIGASNVLGAFTRSYDGSSRRIAAETYPNGQAQSRSYDNPSADLRLHRVTWTAGVTPISDHIYNWDSSRSRIVSWSQQAGSQPPDVYSFAYDNGNELLSALVTNSGVRTMTFGYGYDLTGNRLSEQVGATVRTATYNALNQLSGSTPAGLTRSNEWDAAHRLVAVNLGNQRTEFTYDASRRIAGIRKLVNGSEVSHRLFVWEGSQIVEERDPNGSVTKRFFPQGVRIETGSNPGNYYYTRDHAGSVRELIDGSGNVRARYAYDPYGRRTKLSGDLDADYGFTGMFWAMEAGLGITQYRVYDPELGRWLSRDPLRKAELSEGPNLYTYAGNEPVNRIDPLGLCTGSSICACFSSPPAAAACAEAGIISAGGAVGAGSAIAQELPEVAEEVVPVAESCAPNLAEAPVLQNTVESVIENPPPVADAPVLGDAPTVVAETLPQVGPVMNPVEQPAWDWLNTTLQNKDLLPGYDLLTPEHTREMTLSILEQFERLRQMALDRDFIDSILAGLDL